MSQLNQRKDQFMSQIDDLFGFNLTNKQDTVSYDFGQYKLNKLYKPLVKYFIEQFHKHLADYDTVQAEKILGLFLDFYSLYYSNGDFGYFKNRFSTYQYRIPYSGKDTEFWRATKDCYYVKTSDVVNDMAVSLGGMFDGGDAQLKFFKKTKADTTESGDEKFEFGVEVDELTDEESEETTGYKITFINREESKENKKTKEKVIEEKLAEYSIDTKSEPIKSTLDNFLKKWGRDYFIHKRLKAFLSEELERYFFQMLKTDIQGKSDILAIQSKIEEIKAKYADDPEVVDFKIGQLMKESKPDVQLSVYETAYLWILNFANILGDLEEFKAKLWNKKRKIIKQEYCISLAKIPSEYHTEVLANEAQQAEWKAMGMGMKNDELRMTNDESLVIDTKNYSGAIREKLLEIGANEEIIGELYHSDNYQALRFMQDEYRNEVKCICIDPPYNTKTDGFLYKDGYKSATWLSMMHDRVSLAQKFLKDNGVLFCNIDDYEIDNLSSINKSIFGNNSKLIWKKSGSGRDGKMKNTTSYRTDHEYITVSFNGDEIFNKIKEIPSFENSYGNPDNDPRGGYKAGSISRKESSSNPNSDNFYSVSSPSGKVFTRQFDIPKDEFDRLDHDGRIYRGKSGDAVPAVKIFTNEKREITPYSVFTTKGTTTEGTSRLADIIGDEDLAKKMRPKPPYLMQTLSQLGSDDGDIIMDFFLGTGSTFEGLINLNKEEKTARKFIGADIGEHFNTVMIPRIKKVMYSDNRKDGQATDNDGTHGIISYKQLNQYEDRFKEGGYLSRIDSQIRQLEQTDVSSIHDVKNILYPLRELKERVYQLDDE